MFQYEKEVFETNIPSNNVNICYLFQEGIGRGFMKILKRLFYISCFACILSIGGVNAQSLAPTLKAGTNDNYLSLATSVPAHNGFTTTARRTKYQTLLKQAIRYAYTIPASDSVDVMLKKTTVDGGTTSNASGWEVISSAGDDVIFNSPAAMTTGTFYLYIDSRIGYTKPTMVYGTWYLDDNR